MRKLQLRLPLACDYKLPTGCVVVKDDLSDPMEQKFFLERYNDAFIEEEISFVDACLNDTDTIVGAFDGLQPVLIAIAAKESSEKGGVPVKVMK